MASLAPWRHSQMGLLRAAPVISLLHMHLTQHQGDRTPPVTQHICQEMSNVKVDVTQDTRELYVWAHFLLARGMYYQRLKEVL